MRHPTEPDSLYTSMVMGRMTRPPSQPLDQETLTGHVDASRCGIAEESVPVCVRFSGQPVPQGPPSLLWCAPAPRASPLGRM